MKYLNTVKYLRNFIKSLMKNEECAKRKGIKISKYKYLHENKYLLSENDSF